jgi:hypothetical protein
MCCGLAIDQKNVFPIYNEAVKKLSATGATLMLFTVLERTGNTGKTADMWAERFSTFNKKRSQHSCRSGRDNC